MNDKHLRADENLNSDFFYISIKPITCNRYEVGMLDLNLFFIKAFCSCNIQIQMATAPNKKIKSPKGKKKQIVLTKLKGVVYTKMKILS